MEMETMKIKEWRIDTMTTRRNTNAGVKVKIEITKFT